MADETVSPETMAAAQKAAQRLHHLSMRYAGSLIETISQQPVGMLKQNHPGLKNTRDLIDLVLFCRAEINGLIALLHEAGVVSAEAFARQQAEQYEWFTQQKAKLLGVEVFDEGIVIHNPTTQN